MRKAAAAIGGKGGLPGFDLKGTELRMGAFGRRGEVVNMLIVPGNLTKVATWSRRG